VIVLTLALTLYLVIQSSWRFLWVKVSTRRDNSWELRSNFFTLQLQIHPVREQVVLFDWLRANSNSPRILSTLMTYAWKFLLLLCQRMSFKGMQVREWVLHRILPVEFRGLAQPAPLSSVFVSSPKSDGKEYEPFEVVKNQNGGIVFSLFFSFRNPTNVEWYLFQRSCCGWSNWLWIANRIWRFVWMHFVGVILVANSFHY